ncbi:MAG TPA: ABC transporter substrate-binding protein [Thermoleophilaceae bacterium]|nr:ABC transporter substrate-binding protein [Thermoleophilaceae bacterium]
MRKARWVAGLVLALTAALALAACGGKSSSSGGSSTSGGDKGPITIGVTSEKTGPAPILGTESIGIEKAAQYINQHGGIMGRQVKLVIHDNAGDPSKAVSDVRTFASQGIKVMLGGAFGPDCAAEAPATAAAQIVDFCGSTDDLPQPDTHMFGVGLGYTPTIVQTTKLISQYAPKKAAVFADKDKSGDDSATIGPADLKKLGVTPVVIRTDPTAASFKPAIQQAMSKGVQAMWFTECTPAAISAVGEAEQLGFKGKLMLENCLASLDVAKAVKGLAANKQVLVQSPELLLPGTSSNPQRAKAIALYKQVVGKPDTVVGAGWDSMWMAKAAIEKAGTLDTNKLVQTLENNFTFTGVWHGGTMTAQDHRGAQPQGYVVPTYFTKQGTIARL